MHSEQEPDGENVPTYTDVPVGDAAIASGHVTAEQFDACVDPRDMIGEGVGGA